MSDWDDSSDEEPVKQKKSTKLTANDFDDERPIVYAINEKTKSKDNNETNVQTQNENSSNQNESNENEKQNQSGKKEDESSDVNISVDSKGNEKGATKSEEISSNAIHTQTKRKVWRPRKHKYVPMKYDYEPNILEHAKYPKPSNGNETFEMMISKFSQENKEQLSLTKNNQLLREYGLAIYQYFEPIYENVGDDNHRPFMIDLDSLLLDLLNSPLIDIVHGPQTLPIISLLESRLELFCGGGRSVQIVAFNNCRNLWKYSQHLYLREMILYHLLYHWQYEQNLLHKHSYPLVFVFDNFWSKDFSRYCYVYLPVFGLIAKPQYNALINESNSYLLTYLAIYLSALDIPCVHTSEITFESNAMFGFTFDLQRNIRQYIFSTFREETPVAAPCTLVALAEPIPPKNMQIIAKPIETITMNLLANNLMQVDNNKISMRRYLTVYALILMFRDNYSKMRDQDWDFIRLVLIQLGLLEDLPIQYRSQKLPKPEFEVKIGEDDEIPSEGEESASGDEEPDDDDDDDNVGVAKNDEMTRSGQAMDTVTENDNENDDNWDASSDDDDDGDEKKNDQPNEDDFDDDDDDGGNKETKNGDTSVTTSTKNGSGSKETDDKAQALKGAFSESESYLFRPGKHQRKKVMDFDVEKKIKKSWWTNVECLKNFESFCRQCLSILMNELNVGTKARQMDFDKLIASFVDEEIGNNPNDNPNSEFDALSVVDMMDGRLICRLITVDSPLLKNSDSLGITDNTCNLLNELFTIIKQELGAKSKKNLKLFPVIQSEELEKFKSKSLPPIEPPKVKEDHAFIRNQSELVQALVPDLERDLARNGLLQETNKIPGSAARRNFYAQKQWLRGIIVPDDIPPAKKFDSKQGREHQRYNRNEQNFLVFMKKYAQSLVGGKIVLRDVIVAQKKSEKGDNKDNEDGSGGSSNTQTKSHHHHQHHKGQKKGGGHKKGQQKIDVRAEAEKEVKRKEREAKIAKVTNLINMWSRVDDLEARIEALDRELESMSDPVSALPGLQQLHAWCTEAAIKCIPEKDIFPAVRLWQVTFDIFRRFVKPFDVKTEKLRREYYINNPTDDASNEDILPDITFIQNLQKSLHIFGFDKPAKQIAELYIKRCQQCVDSDSPYLKTTFEDVYVPFRAESIRVSVGSSYERFQLQYCGPYMIRGVGSRPDPRVDGFYPDEWQVRLLDIVDRRYSALIVAPTSSGKTFVSYYAIKDVLQNNKTVKSAKDKGIVVYVAPTKALVWQMCADIYSKYGDVFGVFTGDYDRKPLECSVLVCVPETLEQLLMSPQRAELINQIKYVIFDEIHCLGLSEGGETWERLLMLIRSPFLALSATVGHPRIFHNWLKNVDNILRTRQDKYKHKVRMVIHNERWSDLEKFIYCPDQADCIHKTRLKVGTDGDKGNDKTNANASTFSMVSNATTLTTLNDDDDDHEQRVGGITDKDVYIGKYKEKDSDYRGACIKIHPAGAIAMGLGLDKQDEFPPGLAFSPQDSLFLYDAMVKHVSKLNNKMYEQRLHYLKPSIFFENELYINKVGSNEYQRRLKQEIRYWLIGLSQKKIDDKQLAKTNKMLKEKSRLDDKRDRYEQDEILDTESLKPSVLGGGTDSSSGGGGGGATSTAQATSSANDSGNASKDVSPSNKKLSKKQRRALEQKQKEEARKKKLEEERLRREKEKAAKRKRKHKGDNDGNNEDNNNNDDNNDNGESKEENEMGNENDNEIVDSAQIFRRKISKMLDDSKLCEEEKLEVEGKKKRKEIVNDVLSSLAEYPLERIKRMEDKAEEAANIQDCYDYDFVFDNFTQLLLDLEHSNRLPTLVFCLERVKCEQLFMRALRDLEALHENKKNLEKGTSIQRMREEKKAKADARRRIAQIDKQLNNKTEEGGALGDREFEELNQEKTRLLRILGEDVNDELDYRFTFTTKGEEMDIDEIKYWKDRVIKKHKFPPKHPLLQGLERGIGLHHEGLPIQYRHLVETLFRAKHVKVIVSVASLAMGINMPARSVVFAGDDASLNPLNYRQMMGRAGRRGYDNVGYVIFFGIKPRKISYLMTSQLTSLNGHFPITTTYSLRAMQLYHGYRRTGIALGNKNRLEEYSKNVLKNLFHAPFSGRMISKERLRQQIRHQFRYSLEYQLQNGLIHKSVTQSPSLQKEQQSNVNNAFTSQLDGLSGLVAELHSYEPDNYAFANVLESGKLHEICAGYKKLKGDITSTSKRKILCKLLLVLCNIFVRHPLPSNYDPAINPLLNAKIENKQANMINSYLILPTLEEHEDETLQEIAKILQQHNVDTLNMFSEYYRIFAETDIANKTENESKENDNNNHENMSSEIHEMTLPQSFISFESENERNLTSIENSNKNDTSAGGNKKNNKKGGKKNKGKNLQTLVKELSEKRFQYEARSSFLGLSGLDDNFHSRNELIESLRVDMAIEPNSIPVCEFKDLRGRNLHLNAFAYDFYIHGDYKRIVSENSIRDGQAWQLLKKMQILLKKISKSLNYISNVAVEKAEADEIIRQERKVLDAKWKKVDRFRGGRYSALKGVLYKDEENNVTITKVEYDKMVADIENVHTPGDDFVCCLKELSGDFGEKFRKIVPIGPISKFGK